MRQHFFRSYLPIITLLFFPSFAFSLSVEDFLKPPAIRDVAVSPDGHYMAIVWDDGKTRTVSIRDMSQPEYPQTALFGDSIIRPSTISWANNKRLLVNMLIPEGTESVRKKSLRSDNFDIRDYRMYARTAAVDWNGKNFTVLMGNIKSIRTNRDLSRVAHYLPDDPNHVLMQAFNETHLSLFKVNIESGEAEKYADGIHNTVRLVLDESGNLQGRIDYLRIRKALDIYGYAGDDKWNKIDRIYLDNDDKNDFELDDLIGSYGKNQFVYLKENKETGYKELLIRRRGSSESTVLVRLDNKDVKGTLLNQSGTVIGYLYEEDDVVRHFYFDEGIQKRYRTIVSATTSLGFSGVNVSAAIDDASLAVVRTFGLDDPGSYLWYDFKKEKLNFFGFSFPHLKPENLAKPAVVSYKTRDGLLIRAFLLLPPGFDPAKPAPLVMLPHGGPQARDYAYYDELAQFIATRGYIVMQPNFRGSTGYGKAFEEAGYKQWGAAMQDDLEDGVQFLVKRGYVDPQRTCIVGISYGGYAALMGMIKTPNLYRCAVSMNGVTHLRDQIKYDMKKFKDEERILNHLFASLGHPQQDKTMLDQASPALHAEKIQGSILLVAGTNDDVVPYNQAKTMSKALKKAKKDFDFIILKDTGHNPIYYEDDIRTVYTALEKFLAEHLK